MRENQWHRIENIFNRAVVLAPQRRRDFIGRECRGEKNLYHEVTSLLSADNRSGQIFDNSPLPMIGKLLNEDVAELIEQSDFASYKLLKLLGRGGAGSVFLAEDQRLRRDVAIKILPRLSGHTATVQRFRKEALAASGVVHQNVAHVYEFDSYNDTYFLAMEYVAGKTLREMLVERGKIELRRAIEIAVQIAQALRAAHRKHIYHRDIKPENIMLTEDGLVKVLDFGLAKLGADGDRKIIAELESVPGLILGTTAYMSPEQIRADNVDGKSDLWSLGVILYEMLTGARPFQGRTPSDVQAAVLLIDQAPLPLASFPAGFGKIVKKLLDKDITTRYQSADEVLLDLSIAQREAYDFSRNSGIQNWLTRLFRRGGNL